MDNKCCECGKDFASLYNLRKHAKKYHLDKVNVIVPRRKYKYQCEHCNKNFNQLKDFNYHKNKHDSTYKRVIKKHHCPLCNLEELKSNLLNHFEVDHDVKMETNILEFPSFEEFIAWKTQLEKTTRSQFVKKRATVSTKNEEVIKYFCHRSGSFTSESKGLRHLKTQGSNKINSYCPAYIKVNINKNDQKCQVLFVDTHVGHENDLGHLVLTSNEREVLANKMALQIPFPDILNDVRDSEEGSQLDRIHLLTKRDLYNIGKSFKRKSQPTPGSNNTDDSNPAFDEENDIDIKTAPNSTSNLTNRKEEDGVKVVKEKEKK